MNVLMLGWEFPPYITGGLGTACYGLTRALDRRGTRVTFVLPKAVDTANASHVRLVSPGGIQRPSDVAPGAAPLPVEEGAVSAVSAVADATGRESMVPAPRSGFEHARFLGIPSPLVHPYQRSAGEGPVGADWTAGAGAGVGAEGEAPGSAGEVDRRSAAGYEAALAAMGLPPGGPSTGSDYGGNLFAQVHRYARFCLAATRRLDFDIIHAHDWLTYPAGLAVASATGRPLVVHVHSTEFDRSGLQVNQPVYDVERRGIHGAMRVIAVSQLTKNVLVNRYGVRPERVEVVYNGVDIDPTQPGAAGIRRKDKIVLYFGRITYQKGPEYFVAAARRVLEIMPDVKFVVAGSGDMAKRMIEMAAELGIGQQVLFTGFLRGSDIPRVFAMADLYVMPSVSEPFGIAPLEAMSHDVPVLISKSSGVSEVLMHALKADFWDIDDMADKIIAVLRHPPLSKTLREHGAFEVRRLTWDGAAQRCEQIYRAVVHEMRHPVGRG